MKMFHHLDIETSSLCNRRCPTCIRNSHPNRKKLTPWFKQTFMPIETIKSIVEQYNELLKEVPTGRRRICLSHFNEPLLDNRIAEIAEFIKSYGLFYVYIVTNGDFLTEERAKELDGVLDHIEISVYEPAGRKKIRYLKSLFKKTNLNIKVCGHELTHFSPNKNLPFSACSLNRLIINHKGQYLLCCDDVIGNFRLGSFPKTSLKDFWFGKKHLKIVNDILSGNRNKYHYCKICPR